MEDLLIRIWEDLAGRVGGPMKFRLILQPTIAAIFAIRAGLGDAVEGKPAYFWAILSNPSHRSELLREGWKAVSKVFAMAVAIDVIYQYLVLRWFYPAEALIVAFGLAFIPYLLIRGPVNRMARRFRMEDET
ncbi:MAG: hypothetical protein HY695_23225 [Deltaproteobacteria bacterium]|nr:hypothetical protein [Deltaproteobacteria bacterium]